MSVERTLMSWIRTSFSMIGFGFTISQFFEKFQEATMGAAAVRPEAPRNLGLSLIAVGALGSLIALVQYYQMVKYLSAEEFRAVGAREGVPLWSLSFAVAIVVALIGCVTFVWIVARG
jgi:putative membrane protein